MSYKKHFLTTLLLLSSSVAPIHALQTSKVVHEPKEDPIIAHLMAHLKDSHAWHLTTIGHRHITLYLPVILYKKGHGITLFSSRNLWNEPHKAVPYKGFVLKQGEIKALDGNVVYDLSVTKNVASILLSVFILLIIFLSMAQYYKNMESTPRGGWVVLAFLVNIVRNNIAKPCIGEKNYKRFTPYLLTLFFYIWLNNLMGLLPGAANVTGNISVTLVLSLFTFFITNLNGSKHYWQHIFNPPGVPKWLLPIMVPIEILGIFTKIFTLMFRLFINMLVGHLVLFNIIAIIFILNSIFAPLISVPLGAFIIMIKLFVSFFQAFLFTLLSATYLGAAVAEDEVGH